MPAFRALVTGATGFLGPFVTAALRRRHARVVGIGRSGGDIAVDLVHVDTRREVLVASAPDVVVHLAAMSRMSDCATDPDRARLVNAILPGALAEAMGGRLLMVSTDLVFDGRAAPFHATDPVGPLSTYGMTKAEGEERVHAAGGKVVRLPLLFGPDPAFRGATGMIRAARMARKSLQLFTNEYRTPLHAADAAVAIAGIAARMAGGDAAVPQVLHLPGPERLSRWDLGQRFCAVHGLPAELLVPVECEDATRPRDVSLVGEWRAKRKLDEMLADS